MIYEVLINQTTNEKLFVEDFECNLYDKWNKLDVIRIEADTIDDALNKAITLANKNHPNWYEVTHFELVGYTKYNQHQYYAHKKSNDTYIETLYKQHG